MDASTSIASTFSLDEEGGGSLRLTGRALPYAPLTVGGKQRAEFTWYPGSPQATVQMLGPEEDSIALRGYWKDKFIIGSNTAVYLPNGTYESAISSVLDLVKIVDDMRRMGRRIKLSWDSLIRYGHIVSFTQTWHTGHYCEWEMEFAVASQEEETVAAGARPAIALADIAAQSTQLAEDVRAAKIGIVTDPNLNPLQTAAKLLNDLDNLLLGWTNQLVNVAQITTASLTLPSNSARQVMATASGNITAISQAVGTGVDTALSEVYVFNEFSGQDATPFGVQLNGASYQRYYNSALRSVRYSNATWRYEATKELQDELRASFVAAKAMDLRDVSTRFYGNANSWRDLMLYNGLQTSDLAPGQIVWVPQNPQTAGAGLTQGGAV